MLLCSCSPSGRSPRIVRSFFHRTGAAIVALSLCAALNARAALGDATISATDPVFGEISVQTSSRFAAAVSSIQWDGKEFINNWDHGRQLQLNAQFFNRGECYNPYEAGSQEDFKLLTTSARVLSLTASGNTLSSSTQMAWYLPRRQNPRPDLGDYCGDPRFWLPLPGNETQYTGQPSPYRVDKSVTIGYHHGGVDIPNVIEYSSQLYIPEQVLKGLNNVTVVMPFEFSSIRSYDVVSKSYRNIRLLAGEDDNIKVAATADGKYALSYYVPELLQPYSSVSDASWWRVVPPDPLFPDLDFPCVHVGSFNRYDAFNGPGYTYDRAFIVLGNLDQVKSTLATLHNQFSALDRDVFNWEDYVTINGFESALTTPAAAENHWLNYGIAEGRRGSKTFSPADYLSLNPDLAAAFGATNYAAAISHYVASGRSEGRSTMVQPSAGMQHLVAVENRSASAAGQNVYGQLGNGTTDPSAGSTEVSADPAITEVAAGDYTSLMVKNDGSLWMWGSNQYGARGDGSSGDTIAVPVQVPLPVKVTTPSRFGKHAIAVGTGTCAAIDNDGRVWTWGVNWNGRLGDGTVNARYTPAPVLKSGVPGDYLTGITSITTAGGVMAAIDGDTTVWTWGAGSTGSLGSGSTQDSAYAVQVVTTDPNNASTPLIGISQVACGSSGFCIGLARYGEVFGWGSNEFSQLGFAPGGSVSIAIPIFVGPNAIDAIAAGSAHCLAHSAIDDNVYGWGYNGRGQLGTGYANVAQYPPVAMNVGPDSMNNITQIAAGSNFSAMVRYSDRAVFVAGDNQSGQLSAAAAALAQYVPVRSSLVITR